MAGQDTPARTRRPLGPGKENSTPVTQRKGTAEATLATVLARLEKMEAELASERAEKEALQKAHDDARFDATDEFEHLDDKLAEIEQNLFDERQANDDLRARLAELETHAEMGTGQPTMDTMTIKMIPRPKGTAGTNWSIQTEMGLAGSKNKRETYKALQRSIRDLAMNARIRWESEWAQIPAADKSLLFQVARDQHSFLKRFVNDWATEEIVKQFMKNKRKNHYRNGWLEPPAKYAYLKQNSCMRDPTASRTKRVNMHPEAEGSRKKRNTGAAAAAAREEDDSGEE